MKAFLLLCVTVLSSCSTHRHSDVQVTKIWAQPINGSGTAAAVYMTISDSCSSPDKLTFVKAALPQKASLHASSVVNHALEMTPLQSIPIQCGKPFMLKPMGMHVMVTGIRKPMGIGDRLPLTLTFDRSGDVSVVAEVTTMAVLENVDPMHMHMDSGRMSMKGMH